MKIGRKLFLFLLMPLLVGRLYADPQITAKLSAAEVVAGGQVFLSYEISGVQNVGSFPSLNIPGFQIDPAGQTKSYQWVNGVTTSLITFNFSLTPTQPGTFTIPPITMSGAGKNISSNPLTLTVVTDNGHPAATNRAASASNDSNQVVDVPTEGIKPVFMTASVDTQVRRDAEKTLRAKEE